MFSLRGDVDAAPRDVLTLTDAIAIEAMTRALLRARRTAKLAAETGPIIRGSRRSQHPEAVTNPLWRSARLDSQLVLRWVQRARSHPDEVLADYPYLQHEDVLAALEYAAAAVSERELPSPASA